jgi:hypothetical protein
LLYLQLDHGKYLPNPCLAIGYRVGISESAALQGHRRVILRPRSHAAFHRTRLVPCEVNAGSPAPWKQGLDGQTGLISWDRQFVEEGNVSHPETRSFPKAGNIL